VYDSLERGGRYYKKKDLRREEKEERESLGGFLNKRGVGWAPVSDKRNSGENRRKTNGTVENKEGGRIFWYQRERPH